MQQDPATIADRSVHKRIKRLVAEIERHAARGARRMAEDAAWDLSRLIEDECGTPADVVYDFLLGEG